jgi:hypothetical protein
VIGPGDLPEDPFGEGGMSQVVCGCTSDTMHLIVTRDTFQVRCAQCKALHLETPLPDSIRGDMNALGLRPELGERTTIELPPEYRNTGLPQVGAAWIDTPGVPQPPAHITREQDALTEPPACGCPPGGRSATCPIHGPAGTAPALPNFSAGMCNAFLEGGPYDGQITWIMNGPGVDFTVAGVGTYKPTRNVMDGRVVYTWAGSAGGAAPPDYDG